MKSVLQELNWNPFFRKLEAYGNEFINESKVNEISGKIRDGHMVLHRLLGNEIPEWIRESLSLPVEVLQIFASKPGSIGRIHKDGLERKATLNIPIMNCNLGYVEWFDNDFTELKISDAYTQIRVLREEITTENIRLDYEPIYRSRITVPSMLNTDVWHRVNNIEGTEIRYMLGLRFKGNPPLNEMAKGLGYV